MAMSIAEIAAKTQQGNQQVQEAVSLLQMAKEKLDEAGTVYYGTISDKLAGAKQMTQTATNSVDEAIRAGYQAIEIANSYIATI